MACRSGRHQTKHVIRLAATVQELLPAAGAVIRKHGRMSAADALREAGATCTDWNYSEKSWC